MQEQAHITQEQAYAVVKAIRNKGGVFIGTQDWCDQCGITTDQYDAFLDAGVDRAREMDYLDSHADIPASVTTVGTVKKYAGDGDKTTLTVELAANHVGDIAKIRYLCGEPANIMLIPANLPLPLDYDSEPAENMQQIPGIE